MIHPGRTFCIRVMYAEDNLIEVLTNHKWSLCRAFDHEGSALSETTAIARMLRVLSSEDRPS